MSLIWLKAVPWSTILVNAPHIVEGAKKLVSLVRDQPASRSQEVGGYAGGTVEGAASDFAAQDARLRALEDQQQEAAELLRALADSNAQMARAVETLRKRAELALRIAAIAALGVLVIVIWLVAR